MMKEIIIVGAGFSGATLARRLADGGYKVTVLERRSHIGGNAYEKVVDNGVRVHLYGPHIFHTSSERVWNFISKFSLWKPYEHRVVGLIDGKLVPIPFNFKSIDMLFDKPKAELYKKKLSESFSERVSVFELMNSSDSDLAELGAYVFDKVFVHYTAKQWGVSIDKVDTSTINRVPVVIGYDDRYFHDKFEAMPEISYNDVFDKLFESDKIDVRLNVCAEKLIKIIDDTIFFDGKKFDGIVIWTGRLDELMSFEFGELPYRTLRLSFEELKAERFQPNSVVNYPNSELFTRITEFSYLTGQWVKGNTTILKEYPEVYSSASASEPYYPIINSENTGKYKRYSESAAKINGLYLVGRLAEYRYYNMDGAILNALELADKIINKNSTKLDS